MLKSKLNQLYIFLMFLLSYSFATSQSINFNYEDGNFSSYNLADVRKITFDDDVMNLHLLDGSIYSWNVSTIDHYQYNESSLDFEELINKANNLAVTVFPNPFNSQVNLRFNSENDENVLIEFYDSKGVLLKEQNFTHLSSGLNEKLIDLSSLPKGTYICKIKGKKNSVLKTIIKN